MYRIMIVDDEIPALDYLEYLVDYQDYGFKIVCRARSGREGIRMYEKFHPDLVITDVVMPGMTGLEMADEILKINPECMMILLTAYNEFEYAKKAIQLEVKSYLLKHELCEDTLAEQLNKMKTRLDALCEKNVFDLWTEYEKLFKQYETVPKWVEDDYNSAKSIQNILIVARFAGEFKKISREGVGEWKELITVYQEQEDYQLEMLCLQKEYAVFRLYTRKSYSHCNLSELILSVSLHVVNYIKERYGLQIYVGVSRQIADFGQVLKCFQEAYDATDTSFFKPRNTLFFAGRTGISDKESERQRGQLLDQVEEYAKGWNIMRLEETLQNLMFIHIHLSQRENFNCDMERVVGILYKECSISVRELYRVLHEASNITEVFEKIKSILERRYVSIEEKYSSKVINALSYVHQNIEKPLSLSEVAEVIGLNNAYFSQIFKKEVGVSFKSYVNNKKMEKAEELLKSGQYKIYEISERLGFQSVQHFNNTFKKVTGHVPGEYKN